MTTTELLALFRYEVSDQATPYLWPDATLYDYIDEAQKQFCRDSYGIEDARQFRLSITAANQWYTLDRAILKLRGAINQSTGADVPLVALEKMSTNRMRFDGATGPLKALITGMEKGKLRAYPVPSVASTVELWVFRLSADVVAGDDLEIDAQHQSNLLLWVKYRAYGVQDSEVYDKNKSANYKAEFAAYCARALNEQSRLNHSAGTVTYGGL